MRWIITAFALTAAGLSGCSRATGNRLAPSALAADAGIPAPVVAGAGGGPDGGSGAVALALPAAGALYHGVYPGSANGQEDGVALSDVTSYESAVGRHVAWVYFSDEWSHGRAFPTSQAAWIQAHGSVPFLRLMLRSSPAQYVAEPLFTLDAIAAGQFDADLQAWADGAKAYGAPLIVEYGTEMNGDWFSWNGEWNGGAGVGPAKFRAAYRHIVETIRGRGATNITWAFHFNDSDWPTDSWNAPANYYPGDDVVDWIGFSIYGATSPMDTRCDDFAQELDTQVQRTLQTLSIHKPLFVFEMGCSGGNARCPAAGWAQGALQALLSDRWPQVAGFAWWNETWANDSNPADNSDLRVQTVPGLGAAFQYELNTAYPAAVVDHPLFHD